MTTLYLEWGGDLIVNQTGGLQLATGWDEVRQRIERRVLTNPQLTLADGSIAPADYIFDPTYGLGLRLKIDSNFNKVTLNNLQSIILQGAKVDAEVDTTIPPTVTVTNTAPDLIWIVLSVTLVSGELGTTAFVLT